MFKRPCIFENKGHTGVMNIRNISSCDDTPRGQKWYAYVKAKRSYGTDTNLHRETDSVSCSDFFFPLELCSQGYNSDILCGVFNVLLEISNTYRGLGSSELLNSISIYRKEENFNRINTPLQYLIQMYAVDVMLLFRTVLAVIDGSLSKVLTLA